MAKETKNVARIKIDKNSDLLSGALLPKIIMFTLPLMLSSILQLLFNTADTMVVGRWGGDTPEECEIALAAVGSCGSLISLIVNFFVGLAIGTGVCAAQGFGARNDDQVQKVVHTSVVLSVILGSIVAVIGIVFSKTFLIWMGTDATVLDQAAPYMKAYFVGAPASMLYNYCAAILRSKGDTSRPLLFLSIAGVVNVCLNLVMVLVFRMGAVGVGIATATSHWISCILVVIYMIRMTDACHIDLKKLKVDFPTLSKILFIGIPAGIQSTVFAFSNVIIQSSVNSFGKAAVAGNAAASNIDCYPYVIQNSIYQAAMTFVGQCVGAKRYDRLRSIVLTCAATVVVVGITCNWAIYLFGEQLLSIFVPNNPEVVASGMIRLRCICLPYFLCGVMEVGSGVLRGLGKSLTSMIVAIAGVCGIRLVWIYTVFATFRTLEILYLSYLVCWIITSIAHYTLAYINIKKLKQEMPIDQSIPAIQ